MRSFSVVLILLLTFSCSRDVTEEIVARVNDEVLTLKEFKAFFAEKEWEKMNFEDKKEHINRWVELTLMAQEADRTGISDRDEIKNRIKHAEKNIKSNALLAQKLHDLEISEEDLFSYYKLHKSQFQKESKEYKLQRIFVREKAKLDSVLNLLSEDRIKYTEAARMFSEEAIGKDGGYTGFLGRDDMDESVWNTVEVLDKWYYSTVQIDQGYLIIRYYDSKTVYEEKPFTEVKEELYDDVKKTMKAEIYQNLLEELKTDSDIMITF